MTQVMRIPALCKNKLKQEWSKDHCQQKWPAWQGSAVSDCFSSSFHVICREGMVDLNNVTSVHSWCKILIFMSVLCFFFLVSPLVSATGIKPYLSINYSVLEKSSLHPFSFFSPSSDAHVFFVFFSFQVLVQNIWLLQPNPRGSGCVVTVKRETTIESVFVFGQIS